MKYKIIAAFLVFTMVLSSVAYFIGGNTNSNGEPTQTIEKETTNISTTSFRDLGGRLVRHEFDSIGDALEITPPKVKYAQYIDVDAISDTPMYFWINQKLNDTIGANLTMINQLYGSNTTKMYLSILDNKSVVLFNTIYPEVVAFDYVVGLPYKGYLMLLRNNGMYNVMGTPVIYSTKENAMKIIDFISGYERNPNFDILLDNVSSAEYQEVIVNPGFAEQLYLGIKIGYNETSFNNTYERVTVYVNATPAILSNLNRLKQNSYGRGFIEYNITTEQINAINVTKMTIVSPDFQLVANERYY
ncbi:MAG TPA: hypothetical protein EYP22_00925 [Methanosarcinales archaeon]|nr:hypothetical protein [Methanosarcinales archaeon]